MLQSAKQFFSIGLLLFIFFSLFGLISCGNNQGGVSLSSTPNPTTNPTSLTSGITPQPTSKASTPVTANCLGYEKTDPEVPDQGKTVTFNVTVPNGCDVIVQGVVGKNVGPYNWDNGAVAALGPGSYSFTITDGSYQMAREANGQAAFCNAVNWIQTNGKALSHLYPLPGWGGC